MKIKIVDTEGEDTLNAIAKADKFNYWMYSKMIPNLNGKILEIGSGIGNISQYLIKDHPTAELSDVRNQYTEKLKNKFPLQEVHTIDLVNIDFDNDYQNLIGKFDFVFALNVIEHIEDHKTALINMSKLIKHGGNIFVLVPAYQWLYNSFDISLEHFRRYNIKSINELCPNDCHVKNSFYFNTFGIVGWFLVGSVLKKKIIPEGNMKVYNLITPIVKIIDFLVFKRIGLSVVSIFQKKEFID